MSSTLCACCGHRVQTVFIPAIAFVVKVHISAHNVISLII